MDQTQDRTQTPPSPDPTDYPGWRTYIDQAPDNSQARINRLNEALKADVPIRELLINRDGKEAA